MSSAFTEGLGRASLQGGAALALVWILCRSHRLSPRVKCWLWRLAFLRMLIALFASGTIDLPLLPRADFSLPASLEPREHRTGSSGKIDSDQADAISADATRFPEEMDWKLLIWSVGAGALLVRLALQFLFLRATRRNATMIHLPELANYAAEIKTPRPAVFVSHRIQRPLLTGIIRPAIILPRSFADDKRLDLILKHELAHLQRRDLIWNWLIAGAQTLFWFHPFIWLASRDYSLAQEMACDQLALQNHEQKAPILAALLVELASARGSAGTLLAASVLQSPSTLERRLNGMKNLKQRRSFALHAIALAIVATTMIPWRVVAQKPESPAAPPSAIPGMPGAMAKSSGLPGTGSLTATQIVSAATGGAAPETEELRLLNEELKLAERQLAMTEAQYKSGAASSEDVIQRRRDVLGLRRESAQLQSDAASWNGAMQEEIAAVEQLQKEMALRVENGVAAPESKIKIDRELLQLRRRLATATNKPAASGIPGAGAGNMSMMYYMSNPDLMKRYFPQMYAQMTRYQSNGLVIGAALTNQAPESPEVKKARIDLEAARARFEEVKRLDAERSRKAQP